MENYTHLNKEVVFWKITGEVMDSNKYSETHVSSSGGGGYVGGSGGHISAPRVSSRAVTNHEFWIRTQDGTEESVQLTGHDIPDRKSTRLNSSHIQKSRMPSSA